MSFAAQCHRLGIVLCRCHQRRQGAGIDQLVQTVLLAGQIRLQCFRCVVETCRADGLMGILGVRVVADSVSAEVFLAVIIKNPRAGIIDEYVGQSCAVGTHIGDQTFFAMAGIDTFIQTLGHGHRPLGAEGKLGAGFLLQRTGDERRSWIAGTHGRADLADGERSLARFQCLRRFLFVMQCCLFAVDAAQGSIELAAALFEHRVDRPVFLRDKGVDFLLPFDDQLQCHRLNAAGGFGFDLGIEQFGKLETDNTVKDSSGLLGMDEIHIDRPRIFERFGYGILGDLMERDTVQIICRKTEFLRQVPADGFSFTVRVCCEIDVVGFLRLLLQILYRVCLVLGNDIGRFKIIFNINTEAVLALDREIADMSLAGNDGIVFSEIFGDRLGLRRRLYNYQIFHKSLL